MNDSLPSPNDGSPSPQDAERSSVAEFQQRLLNHQWVEDTLSTAEDHNRWVLLAAAGEQWNIEFSRTQEPQHMEKAIEYLERSVQALRPDSDPSYAAQTNSTLGTLLQQRFSRSMASADMQNAIVAFDRAAELTRPPNAGARLLDLATAHLKRFEILNDPADLNRAIETYQKILSEADVSPSARLRVYCLGNLCNAVRLRYEQDESENAADLQLAIDYGEQALDLLSENDSLRPVILVNLSVAYFQQATLSDIDRAIQVGMEALGLPIDDVSIYVRQASNLGLAFMVRYVTSPDDHDDDLDSAIAMYEKAVERSDSTDAEWRALLRKLAGALHERFESRHLTKKKPRELSNSDVESVLKDLDGALEKLTLSINSNTPSVLGRSESSKALSRLHFGVGSLWQERFLLNEELDDINKAITSFRTAAHFDDSNGGEVLFCLGTAFAYRFLNRQKLEDLDYAIETLQKASQLLDRDSKRHGLCLDNLCGVSLLRYRTTYSVGDLNLVIKTGELAVKLLSEDEGARGQVLTKLCSAYLERFTRINSLAKYKKPADASATNDLDRAIAAGEQAVPLLGNDVFQAHSVATLNEAYEARRLATLESTTDGIPELTMYETQSPKRKSFGYDYITEADGESRKLWREILQRAACIHVGESVYRGEVDLPWWLEDFSDKLVISGMKQPHASSRPRQDQTPALADIDASVIRVLEVIEGYKENRGQSVILVLNLQRPCINELRLKDLHHSFISAMARYLPIHTGPFVFGLGVLLRDHFKLSRAVSELDTAITIFERANTPATTGVDDPNHPLILRHWGEALQARFEERELSQRGDKDRELDLADIDNAILKLDKAVGKLPANSEMHVRADYLKALADALTTRFEVSRMPDFSRPWMEETEWDISMRGYNGFVMSFPNYKINEELAHADIDRAVDLLEQAIGLVKDDAKLRALYSWHRAKALRRRHELTKSANDRSAATRLFEFAAKAVAAPLSCRIPAANEGVDLLIASGDMLDASTLARFSVELLRLVPSLQEKPNDGKKMLSLFRGMTARAVSLSVACGEGPFLSVLSSEIGRGILSGDHQHMAELEDSQPSLARQFHDLRKNFDAPRKIQRRESFGGSILKSPDPHSSAVQRHEELLSEIQQQPGLELFLNTLPKDATTQLVEEGPVVILNVSQLRSDAILITSEGIRCLHLDQLNPLTLQRKAQDLVKYTEVDSNAKYVEYSRALSTILEWLWDVVVEPVLNELGFTQTPGEGEAWPRVWWIATGILSILPIHAAGYHSADPPRTTMDRVVSSYVPTVKALAYARSRSKQAAEQQKPKAILVAMPETPEKDKLEFAEKEVNSVRSLIGNWVKTEKMEIPTKAGVLAALKEYEIAHIVCHGEVSVDDPSLSQLFLTDWKKDRLVVSDIAKVKAGSAQFAYLAACHTSSVRELNLMDESIHLSSSVLLAGFPSVIGTLWAIEDESSIDIARKVYEGMLEATRDGLRFNSRVSAMALHHALRSVRQTTLDKHKIHDPLVWAPFVHIGV